MRPTPAANAQEALSYIARAAELGEPFSLVLTDAHMPEMDGFGLAERIKASPHLADAVIMMLTSGDRLGDSRLCRELGIAAYLMKPVRRDDLRAAIIAASTLPETSSEDDNPESFGEGSGLAGPPEPRSLRVLLTEDNPVNQRVARRILEKAGYAVTSADNGREALEALNQQDFDFDSRAHGCPDAGHGWL